MSNNNFKKSFLALAITMGIGFCSQAQAGVPAFDGANLMEKITANITEMKNWADEKAKMALEMDMEALMSKLSIANTNNAFSNMIARSGAALQSIQNLDIYEQSKVDGDVCGNVAFSLFDSEVACYVDDRANAEAHDIMTDDTRYDLDGTQFDKHRDIVTSEILEKCNGLLTVDDTDIEPEERPMYSQCIQAGSLLGIGTDSTFSEVEEEAINMQIRLLTGPVPEFKKSTMLNEGSVGWINSRLEEMREDAFKSIPISSFTEIAKWRKKASEGAPVSRMGMLEQFVDQRKDPDWILKVAGAKWEGEDESQDTTVYRTELLKKMLVLEVKQTELQLEQFKHQLRLEGINSAMLSIMVDPL